jgi:MYXO-CTERM domain-containing protein
MPWPVPLALLLASAAGVRASSEPAAITGGTPVTACGWPTAVWAAGCSGTLVDPEIVVLAAHCSAPSQIVIGERRDDPSARTVDVAECRRYDAGPLGPGEGTDFQWCRLVEPQFDVPIVPPLLGCEVEVLQEGTEVTIVGFGVTPEGLLGVKHAVTTQVNALVPEGAPVEAQIGGAGADSCQGDSGGPVFIELPDGAGWRVFGVTSYGSPDCMSGGFYSLFHIGMPWLEATTGRDLSPCHTADGTWDPGPRCGRFPLNPATGIGLVASGCEAGPITGRASTCGDPWDGEEDTTSPGVDIVEPEGDTVDLDADPATGTAMLPVVISAADEDWGLSHVELRINGILLPGASSRDVPFSLEVEVPRGEVLLRAHAFDLAGLTAQSQPVLVRVDAEEDEDGALPELQGCGCTSTPGGTTWLGVLLVLTIRRRDAAVLR